MPGGPAPRPLARPRHFGKRLFLDTLKQLFACSRNLFRGLAIEPHWDWPSPHPVVRLSFGTGCFEVPGGLHDATLTQLRAYERSTGLRLEAQQGPGRFAELLEDLHRQSGRPVVVLVDDCDQPILDVLSGAAARPDQPQLLAQPVRGDQELG